MSLAKQLADMPKGKVVFIDANIFHFYLRGPLSIQKACTNLLERIERNEITGYTSALILDELIYKILLKKIEEKYRRNPLDVLHESPEEIGIHSAYVRKAVTIVAGIAGLVILAVEKHHIEEAIDYMQKYLILPRDAVHLSVMKSVECDDLVSADKDFDKVIDLNRWTPL